MRRKAFDVLASAGGAVMVVVLVVAGSLLMWGASFTDASVHSQLARQEIVFPSKAAFAHAKAGTQITPSMIPSVSQYAGQKLLSGQQAEAYANHFIAVHLSEMPYHGVYSTISTELHEAAPGSPQATTLAALQSTSFQGTTLRGLLLEAYAFSVLGLIAFWAGIAAFISAGVMALLAGLGIWHARQVPADVELLGHQRSRELGRTA